MALSIVNNPTAIGAQGGVNSVNNSLAKTIKSLSTGLRINTAADDASGLAVSEKLRAQISGLNKAATNAQDAISMLQTAEGAMGSMTSMVQRIRELAVQAGDPAYTTNDRAMLQLEVDQLKEEIDRVSSSTEFNTKKLLNGDAAALWSASTDDIEAVIKGAAAEGNYKLSYDVDPGRNSVYKSNIMRLGAGEMSYDINSNPTGITKLDNISGMMREDNINIEVGKTAISAYATGETLANYYQSQAADTAQITGTKTLYTGNKNNLQAFDMTFTQDTNASAASTVIGGNSFNVAKGQTATGTVNLNGVDVNFKLTTAGVTFSANSSLYLYQTANATLTANDIVTVGNTTAGVTSFTGKNEGVLIATALQSMNTLGTNHVEMEILTDAYDGSKAKGFQVNIRTRNAETGVLSDWEYFSVDTAGKTVGDSTFFAAGTQLFDAAIIGNLSTNGALKEGDKILGHVSKGTFTTAGDVANDIATGITAYATVKLGDNGATVTVRKLTSPDTRTTTTFYTAQMDKSGKMYYGQMDIQFEKGSIVTGSSSIDILGEGDVASKYTKLSQLAQFTNTDGRMVLDNTQEISIYAGNGKVAKVTLEGSDTIADLENKLTSALVEQLGMGADETNTNATEVNKNLVKFVETPTGGDHAVRGTFVIQGAVLGEKSNLTFVGDEAVLSALGITQIQEAADSALNVRVTDAHTGEFIGEDVVTDNRLRNIIEGVDVIINPESAADVNFVNGKMVFTDKLGAEVAYLHIKDNATKAAVGANEGQVIDISIGRLDTVGMGIDGINVATFDDAQKAITKLDMALEQISAARATAGAQMNRLEYTITNLNTTRENMVSAESRIRDLDIAQASTDLAAQQVLLQSATAMLAQANQIPSYAAQLLQ
ncbi:MAG: hypothetical protein K2N11_02160 [Mucispirillum sp.]|nr:hypothetical protein [Mucispirillum sp.]